MAIRAEYTVEKLPDSYVTKETHYKSVEEDKTNRKGEKLYRLESEEVESKGGYLFTFLNGSSIRLTSLDQMATFGLRPTPRLIDDTTGEEVNEHGVPLNLADMLARSGAAANGGLAAPVSSGNGVESSIENLE